MIRVRNSQFVSALVLFAILCTGLYFLGEQKSESFHFNSPTESGENHQAREEYLRFRLGGSVDSNVKAAYDRKRAEAANERLLKGPQRGKEESFAGGKFRGEWIERGAQNQSGRVIIADVLESKDLLILGTDGGSILLGPLSGNDFEILNNNFNMVAKSIHVFDMGDTDRVVVMTKRGIFLTDDNGKSWKRTFEDEMTASTLSRKNNTIYAVTHSGKVLISKDQGGLFSRLVLFLMRMGNMLSGQRVTKVAVFSCLRRGASIPSLSKGFKRWEVLVTRVLVLQSPEIIQKRSQYSMLFIRGNPVAAYTKVVTMELPGANWQIVPRGCFDQIAFLRPQKTSSIQEEWSVFAVLMGAQAGRS